MKDIETLLDLPNTRLHWIDAGTFLFQNEVEITFEKGFYAGCYQVTQELYEKVMRGNPSYFKGKRRAVECISWSKAQHFLQRLNERVQFTDGLQFRLPSETQWEYAARAKQNFDYSGSQKLHEVGWFKENSNGQTMPVGLKQPNGFGLYDMSGNVWEWCDDNWNEELHKTPLRGLAFKKGDNDFRVARGGSWLIDAHDTHLLYRKWLLHDIWNFDLGFRVFRY